MQKKTIAIMAAGLGSRFGGSKQLFSFTDNNYSLLDFSIYDAIQAGFNSIIFIVNKNLIDQFQKKYASTLPLYVSVSFCIQNTNSIPAKFKHINRKKPWGTGHALLTLKGLVNDKFAIINADDFYGKKSFDLMYKSLFSDNSEENFLIGFQLNKTLSENGSVSRGECFFNKNNNLSQIVERSQIAKRSNSISYIESGLIKTIKPDSIVSMNFWGFNLEILEIAEREFYYFLKNYKNEDLEFYITKIIEAALIDKKPFKIIKTDSEWFGITYKEDVAKVNKELESLIERKYYPSLLW